jgi:hypothetical protein
LFETEEATDRYLAEHSNAPVKSLSAIVTWQGGACSRTNIEGEPWEIDKGNRYLELLRRNEETRQLVLSRMADHRLDAQVYATFDLPPALVAPDALTNPNIDLQGAGNNRRLAPILGFPALTVPAGFTSDGLPSRNRVSRKSVLRNYSFEAGLRIRTRNSSSQTTAVRRATLRPSIIEYRLEAKTPVMSSYQQPAWL